MSLHAAYDPDNIFAKIVRGDMPAVKVWEDDDVLAFMDVFPQAPGHVLVIHKVAKARNLLDIEPHQLSTLAAAVQKTARAVEAALKPDGLTVMQFNGEAGGQTVYHLHFHIIPRGVGQPMGRHSGEMADMDELKAKAAKIAAEVR